MNKKKSTYSTILALFFSMIPYVAYAHEGGSVPIGGFLAGLIHPVLGYDHLLAMLSVGVLSAQIGGRAIWTVPATFVTVMALGGLLGLIDIGLTSTELGISASLVLLGLVIAAERRLPILLAMAGVGFFAIFHGYAHGTEMPTTARPVIYALGFLTDTAAIHIGGVVIADIARHYENGKLIVRAGGGIISLIGVLFLAGMF